LFEVWGLAEGAWVDLGDWGDRGAQEPESYVCIIL